MVAYCGLNCLQCDGYLASQSGNIKKIADVAKKWSIQFNADIKPEHVICDGCKADGRKSFHCENLCEIRKCAVGKKIATCADCATYPCANLSFVLDNSSEAKNNLEQRRKSK